MPVRIDHEGGIISRPVMKSKARTTVIDPAGLQRFRMESVDRGVRRSIERKVKPGPRGLTGDICFLRARMSPPPGGAISSRIWLCPDPRQSERSECGVVESDCGIKVRDAERKMTEHASLLRGPSPLSITTARGNSDPDRRPRLNQSSTSCRM